MDDEPSGGWENVAGRFAAIRSEIGADIVRRWTKLLPPGGLVVDIGCGSGVPISEALVAEGFEVCGIDPSPTLLAMFRRRFPAAPTACEAAETSRFFDRRFNGAVAIGLLFLLPDASQREVVHRVGRALKPGGHFLFSAPRETSEWNDTLTGRPSLSLGEHRYRDVLASAGFRLAGSDLDAGGNHDFDAVRIWA